MIIFNNDDENCINVAKDKETNKITFGINNESDWMAKNIEILDGFYTFDAVNKNKNIHIKLNVPGYHNIYNALSVIALADFYKIQTEAIQKSFLDFTGAHRRFEYVGILNEAKIYDDYAHHPTEIKATIKAAKALNHNKLWVIFQPHTYTRTYTLFNEFSNAFEDVDELILTDIYAAREIDTGIVSSKMLSESINKISNNCTYLSNFEEIKRYLKENVKENDLVLTVGAGSITKLGYELIEK